MIDTFSTKSDAQLLDELGREIRVLHHLVPRDQQRIVTLARGLLDRGMPLTFIIAGVRSTAEVLADLEDVGEDPVMARPDVRRFVEENVTPSSRLRSTVFRGNDVQPTEREQLQQKTILAIREARRSRGRHEIKKTRNRLMKIDQRQLRHRLGWEGEELCREINSLLRTMASLF